jgi:hypothetical protein
LFYYYGKKKSKKKQKEGTENSVLVDLFVQGPKRGQFFGVEFKPALIQCFSKALATRKQASQITQSL